MSVRECVLLARTEWEWEEIGSYFFDGFEPQIYDILEGVTLKDGKPYDVMIVGRKWKDGALELRVTEAYMFLVKDNEYCANCGRRF